VEKGGNGAFRYYRWTISDTKYLGYTSTNPRLNGNSVQASQFKFYRSGGSVSWDALLVENVDSVDGDHPDREQPPNLIDDNHNTKWLDFSIYNDYPAGTAVVIFEFKEPVYFDGYIWATADDAPARDPKSWQLEGSNDEVEWILLDEVEGFMADGDVDDQYDGRHEWQSPEEEDYWKFSR